MKFLTISILAFVIFSGCTKYDVSPGAPSCLEDIIKEYYDGGSDKAKMDEYEFQDELVYLFDDGLEARDDSWPVFDSDCQKIGFLGGLTGNTKINGEEFSHAVYKRTVWPKK